MHCACSKEVNARYETYVLNVGDFDERIFLGDDSVLEIGTPAKGTLAAAYESSERLQITRNLLQNYQDVSHFGMFILHFLPLYFAFKHFLFVLIHTYSAFCYVFYSIYKSYG